MSLKDLNVVKQNSLHIFRFEGCFWKKRDSNFRPKTSLRSRFYRLKPKSATNTCL